MFKKILIYLLTISFAIASELRIDATSPEKMQASYAKILASLDDDMQQKFALALTTIGVVMAQRADLGGSQKIMDMINGKTFKLALNPTGITEIKFSFGDEVCRLCYKNARGEMNIDFGMTKNEFGLFPEEGYSRDIGTKRAPGNYYKCAASAAWVTQSKLFLKVQIIDTYFGILNMNFVFKDENTVGVFINKTAEDFLHGYQGYADGRA